MYIRFEDLEKAFNSVHRHSLWVIINKIYGIPQKLIKMVKALYDDFQCSVMENNEITASFPVVTGVNFLVPPPHRLRNAIDGPKRDNRNSLELHHHT